MKASELKVGQKVKLDKSWWLVRASRHPDSQAAHSNSSRDGKGRGIKADDSKTVCLCRSCHFQFDTFQLGNRAESEAMFDRWLVRVNRMLVMEDKEVF